VPGLFWVVRMKKKEIVFRVEPSLKFTKTIASYCCFSIIAMVRIFSRELFRAIFCWVEATLRDFAGKSAIKYNSVNNTLLILSGFKSAR
jgi:hypothetical protein